MIQKEQILHKINTKTKPLGSLGQLEEVALQLGLIQKTETPVILAPHIVVFAGDHGIAAEGKVNPYPQAVTAQMVLNFVAGGAAINVFCRQNKIGLTVVDAGVNTDFDSSLPIKHLKIAKGTHNYTTGHAMTEAEYLQAIHSGAQVVEELFQSGTNTVGFGEMGIGNTSSAALIMHYYTGLPVAMCVGRGTGVNDTQLNQKIQTLEQVAELHQLAIAPLYAAALLQRIGGYEIAMMAGAYIKASELNMVILVDGFIATAALFCAIHHMANRQINRIEATSPLLQHCIFAHCSNEQGHKKMLDTLRVKPLLDLGLRLGEGTGAALALPLLQSACVFLNEMASFASAGVSQSK
jgi:nicotinate-nucleotide--dimethylbenzimidazole phosphoribosyltransferase